MSSNFVSPAQHNYRTDNPVNHQRSRYDDDDYESRYESLKDAILHKDRGSIMWLMNEGCPINIPELDKGSESPLHVAVFANDLQTARVLLSAGAEVNSFNALKQTPLHMAFEMRNRKMIDLLLQWCDGSVNPFTVYGLSHFHISCVRNNWQVAHAFLQRGVNANVYLEKCFYGRDYVFYRPLHLAVKYENFEVAELLLRYGANVNARDRYKRTPLHLACRYNYKRICEAIGNEDLQSVDDLVHFVKGKNDQLDIVRLLLRYGGEVDALDANNTPPLFHTFKSDFDGIRSAIGDKMDVQDSTWKDLLKEFKIAQKEKFYVLVENGADVKFANESKETLIHLVIDGKRLFTNYIGSMHAKDKDLGDEDKAEIVDSLLQYGADSDAKNANGQTPLQLAISSYYVHTVRTLLDYYASMDSVSFFHYKVPRKDVMVNCSFEFSDMENFLDIIALMLERKEELDINCSNELLMLRYLARDSKVRHLENCSVADLRRLLDFSDINRINLAFLTSENSMLFNREKLNIVFEHVVKLEIAGFPIENHVRRQFLRSDVLNSMSRHCRAHVERCKDEIKRLQSTWVDRYASFYDLMFLGVNEIAVRVKNEDFRRAIRSIPRLKFHLYGNIIVRQFLKGLLRSIVFDSSKEYLLYIIEQDLPDPCLEAILGHLKNEDLCNLSLAFVK
ncbi:ankyrin-1-like [Copidosoma floridanum]|uniref:ankyrin-1-like n=1 Tax=Copidosoma floridanum TaxID=29053 RepID=UPI0006C9AB07|nr:ankyrin-1-like [Copidosoma floridanum]